MAVPFRWLGRRYFGIACRGWYFACRGFPEAGPVKREHLHRVTLPSLACRPMGRSPLMRFGAAKFKSDWH
jgi:hypothetical protein